MVPGLVSGLAAGIDDVAAFWRRRREQKDEAGLRFVSDDLEATPFFELGEGVFADGWYTGLVIEEHGFRGVDFARDFRRRVDLRDNRNGGSGRDHEEEECHSGAHVGSRRCGIRIRLVNRKDERILIRAVVASLRLVVHQCLRSSGEKCASGEYNRAHVYGAKEAVPAVLEHCLFYNS
jgi:hypothetical protein